MEKQIVFDICKEEIEEVRNKSLVLAAFAETRKFLPEEA
jgi:hypothetical protein